MQPPDVEKSLLYERIQDCRADFDHLLQTLESPVVSESGSAVGLLRRLVNPLTHRLTQTIVLVDQNQSKDAWESLGSIQREMRRVMERAQSFFGGLAISRSGLEGGIAKRALELATRFGERAGIDWLPVLAFNSSEFDEWDEESLIGKDVPDNVVRMTIAHWDIWHLPLVAHDYAYFIVQHGKVEAFQSFIEAEVKRVQRLTTNDPPSSEEMLPFLPEVRDAQKARQGSDVAAFEDQMGPLIEAHCLRQRIHLSHMIADALATYLMGPAYVYALIFLALNPSNALTEGEGERQKPDGRPPTLPSDVRRAAIALDTLQRMNDADKQQFATGPYSSDLTLLRAVWDRALDVKGLLQASQDAVGAMSRWHQEINDVLEPAFGFLRSQTNDFWNDHVAVVEILENGSKTPATHSLESLISGAWWCRARYQDRIATLTKDCDRLLAGKPAVGLLTDQAQVQDEASRLIVNKLYDIRSDLDGLSSIFNSEALPQSDRAAVAGRFYRLVSECDFNLRGLERLIKIGASLASSLDRVVDLSGGAQIQILRRETLDFLGGALMRQQNLDQKLCLLAESLLSEYSRITGVNWASRVVLGTNPLFSEASQVVHHRFPDWDIWNLPLMAHEFGHIVAPQTPELKTKINEQLAIAAQNHPEANQWNQAQVQDYVSQRGSHLEEFFADAFATYCQGPAFAYNVCRIHFNPREAYFWRRDHPTHAERMEVILKVLNEMNEQEKVYENDNGPYDGVLSRLRYSWSELLQKSGVQAGPVEQFHRLKANALGSMFFNLLNKYYRRGAQYQGDKWKEAEKTAEQLLNDDEVSLSNMNVRNLLNLGWICRIREPNQQTRIAKIIRSSMEHNLASSQ